MSVAAIYFSIGFIIAVIAEIIAWAKGWGDQGPTLIFIMFFWPMFLIGLIGTWITGE